MARRGKFARLVDDFVATVDALGGSVDPAVVAEELQQRIDAIAAQLRITPQTVLRSYIDEEWGRATATAMMAEVQQRAAPTGPPEHLAVRVAARLLAALGQAVIYAAINGDQQRPQPVLDLRRAGEAVSGLGLAIRDAPPDTPLRHGRRRRRRLVSRDLGSPARPAPGRRVDVLPLRRTPRPRRHRRRCPRRRACRPAAPARHRNVALGSGKLNGGARIWRRSPLGRSVLLSVVGFEEPELGR
ncbi:hypothetical protein AB0M46_41235 [Dactylosporangium sp. NPDC051485]|uniref:hypothetical protein n=1 Tax=Dactylosporangium sp. NPDC051485 TaxID=3154846 RepID=UPI003447FC77